MPTERTPRASTSTPTQPGDVTPTTTAATEEQAKDVTPETTSESALTEEQAHPDRTYHDSLSGRPVTAEGYYTDVTGAVDNGPVPAHRIVANDWAERREERDAKDEDGNTQPLA